jgi:RNA polymerase sigma-70 factor (ECF subfamily)
MNQHQEGCADADRRAFERELLELAPFLRAFARTLAKSPEVAEDLSQNTIVQALKAYGAFIPGTNMKAWLFTIMRNLFYSEHRRAWRQQEWDPKLAEQILAPHAELSEAEATENFRRMLACLACLEQGKSDAIIAVGYLGMSYEEAGNCLDCPAGTVKSRVARGRRELRRLFDTATIGSIDLESMRHATDMVPKTHRLYPIAKAYEDLYGALEPTIPAKPHLIDQQDWREAAAAGAFDERTESLEDLMREDPDL